MACVLLLLLIFVGLISAGCYYYFYHNAHGEDWSLKKQGLRWSAADSDGYSFLAASDPTRVFSEPPSLSAMVKGEGVGLRSLPDAAAGVVARLSDGEPVNIAQKYSPAGEPSPWYRVKRSGGGGWIRGGEVEFMDYLNSRGNAAD
jgi:hypothetical protein